MKFDSGYRPKTALDLSKLPTDELINEDLSEYDLEWKSPNKEEGKKFDEGKPEAMYYYLMPLVLVRCKDVLMVQLAHHLEALATDINDNEEINEVDLEQASTALEEYIIREKSVTELIEGVSSVSKLGATRYGLFNYKQGLDNKRLLNALYRHLIKFLLGDIIDDDSGKNHLYHVLANIYMLIDLNFK